MEEPEKVTIVLGLPSNGVHSNGDLINGDVEKTRPPAYDNQTYVGSEEVWLTKE